MMNRILSEDWPVIALIFVICEILLLIIAVTVQL